MKNINTFMLAYIMCICFVVLSSCEKLAFPTEDMWKNDEGEKSKVVVVTRSATDEALQYPITVYAFDADGKCVGQQIVNTANSSLEMSLTQGNYRLVAIGSSTGYDVPSSLTLNSFISCTSDKNFSTSSLQIGQADVSVGKTNVNATVALVNYTSRLSIELNDVPDDVTSVNVSVSNQNSKVSLLGVGDAASAKSSVIELHKNAGKWVSGNVYTLASAASTTSISVTLTTSVGSSTYAYTYAKGLVANTPYNISATYSDGMVSMTGTFTVKGWENPIDLSFNFGPNGVTGGESPTDNPGQGTDTGDDVTGFPEPGTMFKGFFVVSVEKQSATTATAMIMSLKDWSGLASAKNENGREDDAEKAMANYSEGVVTEWLIPDADDVVTLQSMCANGKIDAVNAVLQSAGASPIDTSSRYLCNEAQSTFSFVSGSISAGGTVKSDYHLRLVAWVTIELE